MLHYLTQLEELRAILLSDTAQLTIQQVNHIPLGFNNNIIWNMGHLLVISEDILYGSIEANRPLHEFEIMGFKRGTKPGRDIDSKTITSIRESLAATAPSFRKLMDHASLAHPELQYDDLIRSIVSKVSLGFLIFHEKMHISAINNIMLHL
ncbi:DinB family protein [Niabella sp. CJ426]|uniref:DinB family protein n=1 Tax=Niabella sp. CJ426 TaxID=3393740 RepID=UPI003CFD1C4F